MSLASLAPPAKKRTPSDVSNFEREQLRFFLAGTDVAATLAAINPSLAWLPILRELEVVKDERQLFRWIEQNLTSADAIKEVVANLHFFGKDTAKFLEYRIERQQALLGPLLLDSWRLIIRHLKEDEGGVLDNPWYEIAPRVKQGDTSVPVLENIGAALRPKLRIGRLIAVDEPGRDEPKTPRDLMRVDFEVEDNLTGEEVLSGWPADANADANVKLIDQLARTLTSSLQEVVEIGIEGDKGYGTSDTDVPSVAAHEQNAHRGGFGPIVRVIADLWSRLAQSSPSMAAGYVNTWFGSGYKLLRRLALFAAADHVVAAENGSRLLKELPLGELFLTGSTVEVVRLIEARWAEFSAVDQAEILRRFLEGPPRDWFRDGADLEDHIDRSLFDILSHMERLNLPLTNEAEEALRAVRNRWPQWLPRPAKQAGFHMWFESGFRPIAGNVDKFKDVSDQNLIAVAKTASIERHFVDGDDWHGLCLGEPDRAMRGLREAAAHDDWNSDLWTQLLWARKPYTQPDTEEQIAKLLLKWPQDTFSAISAPAASWLEEHSKTLADHLLWPLWDRIADAQFANGGEASDA